MIFKDNKSIEKISNKLGYITAYFIFTTVLFFILTFLQKIPESWTYFHIMAITFLIALIGVIIKRLLR